VLSPDLGADLIRVFSIASDGELQECEPFQVTAGNGPRHGAFFSSNKQNTTTLYVVNELGNTLSTYAVEYSGDCLSLSTLNETTPYPTSLPSNAYVSEIHIPDDKIYISIRSDQGFAPNDSMATLEISQGSGLPEFKNLSSSYGTVPRTYVLSPDGSMVAIGDQASSNVAVVARDVETGELGALLGSVQVGSQGQPGQSNGLSSVVWGDDKLNVSKAGCKKCI
jgi:6-phosphogluconolactonase (cycloisomerase 2 family)